MTNITAVVTIGDRQFKVEMESPYRMEFITEPSEGIDVVMDLYWSDGESICHGALQPVKEANSD